jgi:hypothetical protein
MLLTDELRCRAPSMMRQCLESSHRIHASDCFVRGQFSGRDGAERGFAMGLPQFAESFRKVLEPDKDSGGIKRGFRFDRLWRPTR